MSDSLFCVNGERLFRGLVAQVIAPRIFDGSGSHPGSDHF